MENQEERKKKHFCRICRRSFPCGRSLGGHMRSHGCAATSSQPPPETQRTRNMAEAGYGLRENPKKTRRAYEDAAGEETGKEEADLALSLMMLSRDSRLWVKKSEKEELTENSNGRKSKKREKEELAENSNGRTSKKREYQCKSCRKIFPTHQALGGHRASHKRSMRRAEEEDRAQGDATPASSATVEESSTAGSEILRHLDLEFSDPGNDERETWIGQQWPPLLNL